MVIEAAFLEKKYFLFVIYRKMPKVIQLDEQVFQEWLNAERRNGYVLLVIIDRLASCWVMLSLLLPPLALKSQNPINHKQPWKGTWANSRSLEGSEDLPDQAPLPSASLLKGFLPDKRGNSFAQWQPSNATTGSAVMTLFLILLAGRIIMNIKVIISLSLNKPAFPSLKQPDFSCTLHYLCVVFTNPCWPKTLQ